MSSLKRNIRRASARRAGRKWPQRDNGQLISGSIEGRAYGVRVFDYENIWDRDNNPNRYAKVVMVHMRHPTKRRTPGRVCRGKFMQSFMMLAERYGLEAISG